MDDKNGLNKKSVSTLCRRDLMNLGAGASVTVAGMLAAPAAFSQQGQAPLPPTAGLDQASSDRPSTPGSESIPG
jgi:hypothetical protein